MTTIKLKNGSGAPLAGDLVQGEPALDLTNKRLYTEDSGGTVIEVGTNPGEDVTFADNRKAIFGAGSDLEIFHDGSSTSFIQSSTSNIEVKVNGGGNFKVGDEFGNHLFIVNDNGDVQLKHGSTPALKLATTATGIDVTGTVTADGLTVDKSSQATIVATSDSTVDVRLVADTSLTEGSIRTSGTTPNLGFYVGGARYANISDGGDISFYEDTGTTAKMVWKSADERLGIGTSSPAAPLDIKLNTNSTADIFKFQRNDGAVAGVLNYSGTDGAISLGTTTSHDLTFDTAGTERMRIDSSGNVGIGTGSPSSTLEVGGDGALRVRPSTDNSSGELIFNATTTSGNSYRADVSIPATGGLTFSTTGSINTVPTEAMRIDTSGNVLVGKTGASRNVVGPQLEADGAVTAVVDGATTLYLNRKSSDGTIVDFRKDGTTVGSIASVSSDIMIGTGDTGLRFLDSVDAISPCSTSGTQQDNKTDLGRSSFRFDDIYATNGTIQTSDRNEKQDIEALSDAEQRVAVAAKGLLRKFRWIDAVEEKGDDARIHFGIIAQDLQDAFTAEGLDAGRYAMFISTTWWESTEVIPAVEAQEAVVDEEGNVVEEAVEAQEERTVVHTHDTAEEAPEGSVERTRLGVRYSELLAFIIAAI